MDVQDVLVIAEMVADLAVLHLVQVARDARDVLEDVEDAQVVAEDHAQLLVDLIVLQIAKEIARIHAKPVALQHVILIVQVHATVKQLKT